MEEIKCAVYTRKSTDEGLEKEFNTLEAQREAGENYVKSQKHQGWVLIKEHYDDGGFSGGNMNRPSLKRLLRLTSLSPAIIRTILKGHQPPKLYLRNLLRKTIPPIWEDQVKQEF